MLSFGVGDKKEKSFQVRLNNMRVVGGYPAFVNNPETLSNIQS